MSFRFGAVRLDSCSGEYVEPPVCRMDVRLGDRITVFNVVEHDGQVAPLLGEDGARKLLQSIFLAGVTRGDAQLRVKLDISGRGDVVFRFPLLGACEALASLDLIHARECDSGKAAEPVVLAKWDRIGRIDREDFAYHASYLAPNLMDVGRTAPAAVFDAD